MSDPRRLHEDPETELERSLLDAGRRYRASSATRARALAALGIAGATAATSTAAAGSKWASSLFVMAGLAVPAALYLRAAAAPPPSVSSLATARPSASVLAPASPAPELPPAPTVEVEVESPSVSPRKEPRATPSVPLSAELAALDTARSALGRGDASTALTSLDAYSKAFPSGKLRLEAEVLRITALARTGHSAAAGERARAFLRRHPDSLLAPRVRAYLTP